MIKSFLTPMLFMVSFLAATFQLTAQQAVFNEDFSVAQSTAYTTSGPIGTSVWSVARSGQDFGARISGGLLTLTNDAGSSANRDGWVSATTSTSNFNSVYNPILSQNAGIVSWTFNMRQIRSNPRGFESGQYGVAFILAGTPDSNISTGKGWAIQLGNGGLTDPIRLVAYSNGLKTFSTKLSSKASGYTDFGTEYTSIRVEYNPADNKWSLYLRKDGSTFQNPKTGTLIHQETLPHTDFINEPLTMMGGYWSATTGSNQTAFFDNISVSVQTPEIIAINPDSKIAGGAAFTLTVDGKGFLPGSKVLWKGQERPTTYVSPTKLTAAIPASDLAVSGTADVQVRNNTVLSNTVIFQIEPSGAPSLTLSKNVLPAFTTLQGTASTTGTYTIRGDNLTAGATLSAPSQFEMSEGASSTYVNPLVLPNSGGGLTGQPLTVNVRVNGAATAGVYTGSISNSSPGAATKLVALSAKVLAPEPTTAATAVNFSNVTSTGMTVNWTIGNGTERIVLMREASAVNSLPADGTNYSANSGFGLGSEIGTGNFVIFKGSGSAVNVTGLKSSTAYHVSVIEFNGPANAENYRASGAVGSQTTLNSPAGLQILSPNTSYKINFDATVDGVNMGQFQGAGIAKVAEPGQLDSDSWAFTGFDGGPLNFGADSPDDSNFDRGTSTGDVDETGIYAFNVSDTGENYTLGIKPGGRDFNPGDVTLRLHNRTGAPITSLNIGYKVYVKNVENASTTINFSHKPESAGTFIGPLSAVDVVSEAAADLNPAWKASYRVVTLTGLDIPKDSYYNIRWSGSTAVATAAQDEFGIDDIEVIANPGSDMVAFGGIANDFVLAGNALLSADLAVQKKLQFNGGKLALKDKQLTIAGSLVNTTTGGLIAGPSAKLVVSGDKNPVLNFDTAADSNTLQNLSLSGTLNNTTTLANSIVVNALLKTDEFQILDLGTNTLTGTLTSIINNGKILSQNTTASPFAGGKTWGGTGILHLNAASAAQTLVAGTYSNLTLSSTGGTAAAANVTVNGTLNLPAANPNATQGSLHMGAFTLTMGPDGTNTGTGDVTGIIKRGAFVTNKLYTFGHPNSSITFPPAGTLPSTMSAKLTIGVAPTWRAGTVQRQFDIIQTGASGTKAIIRQHYLDSELAGNTESKLVFWAYTASPPKIFDQGRSNNNTAENWVEITNADISLYFKNTFDQVYITLDEAAVSDLTWNGSVSDSWITAANWTPEGVPSPETKVLIPNVANTNNRSPLINATSSVKAITIESGGIVNTPAGSVLNVHGDAGAWQNNGTFNPGNGTVIFNHIDATISGSTTFNNVTVAAGAGLRALDGNYMSIAGTFTNNGTMFTTLTPNTVEFKGTGQVIPNVNGPTFGGYHHLIVSGTGATLAPSIATLNIRGNLVLNQTVSFTGKTVNMAGVSNQTIGGSAAINFDNLTLNKDTGAVLLEQDISVGGTLTLTKGNLVLNSRNLTLGSNPVLGTFGAGSMIVADGSGFVRRPFSAVGSFFFPIGELTGSPGYAPVTVNVTAGTFSNAFVGVNVKHEKHPNNNSSQNYLNKYWNVLQTGITGAVATVTAKYDAADVVGAENEIAAAQLNGPFNQSTNPWIKFAPLAGSTLTAAGATLTSGQTSVFTGIKAGSFSVEVFGYGEFCKDSEVVLTAETVGGDAPFTYIWSNGLENAESVQVPTNVVGEITYTLTVRDANGFVAVDNNSPVKILPPSVGGTVLNSSPEICAGSAPQDLQLQGSSGQILYWQRATDPGFTNAAHISNFTTVLTSAEIGLLTETTYFRAVVRNGDCPEQYSAAATVRITAATWDGSTWIGGVEPTPTRSVIFAGNYSTSAGDIVACSCQINSGAVLTVSPLTSMTVQNGIVNNGTLVVESDGNIVQHSDTAVNSGEALVKRNMTFRSDERKEYNYLISPVEGANLKTSMYRKEDGTPVAAPFVLYHNEANDKFYTSSGAYIAGRSLAVKEPALSSGAVATAFFAGKLFNGKIAYNLAYSNAQHGFNLVGNPYPSNIDLSLLYNDNSTAIESTFQFWDNTVNDVYVQQGSGYSGNSYAVYNARAGNRGTGVSAPGLGQQGLAGPRKPGNIVKVGQGFMVRSLGTGKVLNYSNHVRSSSHEGSVFYGRAGADDRFWLQLKAPSGIISSSAVVYFAGGNNLFSTDDSRSLESSDELYSIVQGEKVSINGRSNFVKTDVIPLGSRHFVAGTYTLSLGDKEGVFAEGQSIYLKDRQLGILTNLSAGSYTFTAAKDESTGRFEIVYLPETVLATDGNVKENLLVYKDGDTFVVKSPSKKITALELYDASGRLILSAVPNRTTATVSSETLNQGVYILKIHQDGIITVRKVRK